MELTEMNLTEEQMAFVQRYVQSHEDRIRTDYSKKLKDVNDELAKYKPTEKSETEKALESRIAALEAKEKEIADRERSMKISDKLKEKDLPSDLAKFLSVTDDNISDTIDEVAQMFGSYFLDKTNKPSNHTTNRGLTKAEFKKMDYAERAKIYNENPQLYNTLIK